MQRVLHLIEYVTSAIGRPVLAASDVDELDDRLDSLIGSEALLASIQYLLAQHLTLFETAGTARLARYSNTEVVIEADSPSGGIVVLNDVWHPWWRATLDGLDTEIFRANAIFRAVQVPPGKFTVRFTFEPLRGAWKEAREKIRGTR